MHSLKNHLNLRANTEIAQVRAKSKSEQTAFQASLRKEQMKVESLERTLEQKVIQCVLEANVFSTINWQV